MRRSLYPVSDYLGAIDLMVTNAGYNSFHECVYGGVPAIFVPNESPEMDDQHLRATYAYASGLGLRLRASELSRVRAIGDIAMSDDFRRELRRRSARLTFIDGAAEAAEAIEQLVFSVRANGPLHESLARDSVVGCQFWICLRKLIRDEIVEAHVEVDLLRKIPLCHHQRPAAVDIALIFFGLERQIPKRRHELDRSRADGDQVGPEFRHDHNWIFATQLAGERDRFNDLADICRRLAKEGDEASWLGLVAGSTRT